MIITFEGGAFFPSAAPDDEWVAHRRLIREGLDARIHHQPGTIFDMVRLFLAYQTADVKAQDSWLNDAVADALTVTRERESRRFRNYRRAQARAQNRRSRRAALGSHLQDASRSEPVCSAASVAATDSPAETDALWRALQEISEQR